MGGGDPDRREKALCDPDLVLSRLDLVINNEKLELLPDPASSLLPVSEVSALSGRDQAVWSWNTSSNADDTKMEDDSDWEFEEISATHAHDVPKSHQAPIGLVVKVPSGGLQHIPSFKSAFSGAFDANPVAGALPLEDGMLIEDCSLKLRTPVNNISGPHMGDPHISSPNDEVGRQCAQDKLSGASPEGTRQKPSLLGWSSVAGEAPRTTLPVSVRWAGVYKLMIIQSDKQDLSFVDKVILPEADVLRLCNDIIGQSGLSARANEVRESSSIDFRLLNRRSLRIIGLYGSKDVMIDLFRKFDSNSSMLTEMCNDTLRPGLYANLVIDVLYVFYWHSGKSLHDSSRKDISCNFIRYIVDLCDRVFICLKVSPSEGEDSLFAQAPGRISKKQRTQRLQIARIKASEDRLQVNPGFTLRTLEVRWRSNNNRVTSAPSMGSGFKLSAGLHRVALLVASIYPPKIITRKFKEKFKAQEFPEVVKEWLKKFILDFSKLPDEQFKQFLSFSALREWDTYQALQASMATRRKQQGGISYDFDHKCEMEEKQLHPCLSDLVVACLKVNFPWEERLVASDVGCPDIGTTWCDSPSEHLDQLESHILGPLLGQSSTERFVFPGQKMTMQCLARKGTPHLKKKSCNQYMVVTTGQRSTTPVMCCNDVRLVGIVKSDCAPLSWSVRFILEEDHGYMGPVLTNVRVRVKGLQLGYEDEVVSLELQDKFTSLRAWINVLAGSELPRVSKNASFVTALSNDLKLMRSPILANLNDRVIQELLVSMSPLSYFNRFLEGDQFESLRAHVKMLFDAAPYDDSRIPENHRAICAVLYWECRQKLVPKIIGIVGRHFKPMLRRRIKMMHQEDCRKLDIQLKQEEEAFLTSTRAELSRTRLPNEDHSNRRLAVTGCEGLGTKSWFGLGIFSTPETELSVAFEMEEAGPEVIGWKGNEVIPMKDDFDKLQTDPSHSFIPTLSAAMDIIDLDPSHESLLQVVLLKQGQILVFTNYVSLGSVKSLRLYVGTRLGASLSTANPVIEIKRGVDMVAFDEKTSMMAFYDRGERSIRTARFDETSRKLDWIGADINLAEYNGTTELSHMEFVTGRNELAVIDSSNRVRVFEINFPVLLRPKYINLGPESFIKAIVTGQPPCLLVLRTEPVRQQEKPTSVASDIQGESDYESFDGVAEVHDETPEVVKADDQPVGKLVIDVYKIDDTMSKFDTVSLDYEVEDPSTIEAGIVSFGLQMELIIHDSSWEETIFSKVLMITTASEICNLQKVIRDTDLDVNSGSRTSTSSAVNYLDYVYHVFDKYATSPPLDRVPRNLGFHLMLNAADQLASQTLKQRCLNYFTSSLDRLQREKGKVFSSLTIESEVHDTFCTPFKDLIVHTTATARQMGDWIRRLVCLVPIQIARAENNGLKPLVDGLQLSANVNYGDAVSLANTIRFGFYEAVLSDWVGPIRVLSSMGKQSSGKSYLLNHLSGSLLDVAGGRCTDGVWMTMRHAPACLYVLLDFEGLGSFERTEQEDMLLSILNAAVSNITIFNKKDFHLDKETEATFDRFQNGVNLVKNDEKLFKGLFYMAIKDVDSSDVEDLKTEFYNKIFNMCSKSESNFLTTMYGGEVEVAALPSFNKSEFHESIDEIARTVEQLEPSYRNGKSFSRDLKLIIAQISAKDWSPIDSKRVALRISLLKKDLTTAINLGAASLDGSRTLINFDTHEEITDDLIRLGNVEFKLFDAGLELIPCHKCRVVGEVLQTVLGPFKSVVLRDGQRDEEWHSSLENFVAALADRRKHRVTMWLKTNTMDFHNDGDVQKLQLEAAAMLAEMKQNLSLCSCKCDRCFLRCTQEKGHPSSHSCLGDHICSEFCTYCREDCEDDGRENSCADAAGHGGPHDCKVKCHTCREDCRYANLSSNCNLKCSQKALHSGEHNCNSRQHMCKELCSLESCQNACVVPFEKGDHDRHECHEKLCPMPCSMADCHRSCATKDHFHALDLFVSHHFCGSVHPCKQKCESEGICEVSTELLRQTQTFTGKRATFDYEHVSEQNGIRKDCCIPIPPNQATHIGQHCHTTNPNVVHFCETRCRSCGYFCNLPMGHLGLHNTTHGNMRNLTFAAETEEIDLLDRKYAWGESGLAEMCNMYCKAQGRGHIHLVPCGLDKGGVCITKLLKDGARHETQKYGPDIDVPKDELSHATHWKQMRFMDPCTADEQQQFDLCNHECKSVEHKPPTGSALQLAKQKSFCTEGLWHSPISKGDLHRFGAGYITDDGHHFTCDHSKNSATNVLFVIDKSGSMTSSDIFPTMTKFTGRHRNRLGCVYEAILKFIRMRLATIQEDVVSVILFADSARVPIELQEMKESIVDNLLNISADGGTLYSSGLTAAERILMQSLQDINMNTKSPVMIFLSDGGNARHDNPRALLCIQRMMNLNPKLVVHTIMFGRDPEKQILEKMATEGHGTFQCSLDEVQLARSFEGLANSLRPKVASLM